jgi:hypothetical protein
MLMSTFAKPNLALLGLLLATLCHCRVSTLMKWHPY